MLLRDADLELRMLPDAHERECMLLELSTRGREVSAGLRSLEQRLPQQILERLHSGAHGRLRNVHALRRVDEAARIGDNQKRPGKVDVHTLNSEQMA